MVQRFMMNPDDFGICIEMWRAMHPLARATQHATTKRFATAHAHDVSDHMALWATVATKPRS